MARVSHPIFARIWARVSPSMESRGIADYRARLLAGLVGEVIEVGAGNGLNFAHYPATVTRVLAVEPEPYLRGIAERAAELAPVPVEVVDGLADELPADDATFDAAVTSLVLCSVPAPSAALVETARVLRSGGQLRFLEHVCADTPTLARVQRMLDATIWPIGGGGCHASRDTATAIAQAGFTTDRLERFRFPELRIPSPTAPHILGIATRADRRAPATPTRRPVAGAPA